jgi:hypothetical protein
VFAVLFWLFLLSGVFVAMMGHSGFYRLVTGRDGGSMDHPDSRGSF